MTMIVSREIKAIKKRIKIRGVFLRLLVLVVIAHLSVVQPSDISDISTSIIMGDEHQEEHLMAGGGGGVGGGNETGKASKLITEPEKCYQVYSFDASKHLQQNDGVHEQSVYHYEETSPSPTPPLPLPNRDRDDGLICFSKIMKCISITTSKRIVNCIYFSREFCTRFTKLQMRSKGRICHAPTPHHSSSSARDSREVFCEGGVKCRHEKALCFTLAPRPKISPPVCLCPAGFTGPTCAQIDLNVLQIDQLHTIDLRNILLKYQQKDRYFIGVSLLVILILTVCSVLVIVACCTFVFVWISSVKFLQCRNSHSGHILSLLPLKFMGNNDHGHGHNHNRDTEDDYYDDEGHPCSIEISLRTRWEDFLASLRNCCHFHRNIQIEDDGDFQEEFSGGRIQMGRFSV